MRLKNFATTHHFHHYGLLAFILLVGMALRFFNLDAKPLWMDEVLTALFTMGRRSQDIPARELIDAAALQALFTLQPSTCSEIAAAVSIESVHPPLFFCLMHRWLYAMQPLTANWIWALRSLPALLGVGAIGAVYGLGRVAFNPLAGLLAAALMAVSPFAVYLSQEARHYTLPMLVVTLALVALVQMQQDLQRGHLRPLVWFGWIAANSLGLYIHYFCILALVAQTLAIGSWMVWQRKFLRWQHWAAVGLALLGVGLTYLPWLLTLVGHATRSETTWMRPFEPDWTDAIAPLYQTLASWVVMVIALPVEDQPDRISLVSGAMMLLFTAWLLWQIWRGFRHLTNVQPQQAAPLLLLGAFVAAIVAQFFGIVYILGKDITVVPRYNFVFYPAVCVLLAACLSNIPAGIPAGGLSETPQRRSLWRWITHPPAQRVCFSVILVGLLSSLLTVNGLVFLKPFYPNEVARELRQQGDRPVVVVTAYRTLQEIAQGLSVTLTLQRDYPAFAEQNKLRVGFVETDGSDRLWSDIEGLQHDLSAPWHLWIIAAGYRKADFPQQLQSVSSLSKSPTLCPQDPGEHHRVGFPFQLYLCGEGD